MLYANTVAATKENVHLVQFSAREYYATCMEMSGVKYDTNIGALAYVFQVSRRLTNLRVEFINSAQFQQNTVVTYRNLALPPKGQAE